MSDSFDTFVTRAQAAVLLGGISVDTVKRWEKVGRLPSPTRLSRKVVGWRRSQLDAALRSAEGAVR